MRERRVFASSDPFATPSHKKNLLPPTRDTPVGMYRSNSPIPPFVPSVPTNSKLQRGFVDIEQVYQPYQRQQHGTADFTYSAQKDARLDPIEVPMSPVDLPFSASIAPTIDPQKEELPAFKEGSIFHQFTQPTPSQVLQAQAKPAEKKSKNSIFDVPHMILKPAVNMTEQELGALRKGEVLITEEEPWADPIKHYSQGHRSSITVPISLPTPPTPTAPTHIVPAAPSDNIEAAFLSNTHTGSSTRGFVDLDETQFRLPPSPYAPQPQQLEPTVKSAKLIAAEEKARQRKMRSISPITTRATWEDRINLTFLPTARNFLGEGRYAQVYLGYYTITDPNSPDSPLPDLETDPTPALPSSEFFTCAVKRLYDTPEAQAVGMYEAQVLRRVSPLHPNIVKFIGVKFETDADNATNQADRALTDTSHSALASEGPPRLLLLLEYLPKGNMWDWLLRNRQSLGRRLWFKWAKQLASAVECIHTIGIVHHDIKPHNILLSDFLDVRLSDFGNAKYMHPADSPPGVDIQNKRQHHLALPVNSTIKQLSDDNGLDRSTPPYTAPELFTPTYSHPVDVYSLGITFYVLLTAHEPYALARTPLQILMGARKGFFESGMQDLHPRGLRQGSPLRFLSGEMVDEGVIKVLEGCLEKDPGKRWTAARVRRELERVEEEGAG